ncbi:arabinosylfuranosidase ArfA [Microlunatus soli]|uniref:non-reducing end alpha-L-arabinofuranosidase n=1 Tax=Microlunatus soli TaxID=630515 RepID=A0A1H1MBG8_9ACTN|nr:alpha-N-arabinofuranosidase [Microlunatus soli]SDR84010.1 alpha-N-arabinofuranosidase [Microlunatus soli]
MDAGPAASSKIKIDPMFVVGGLNRRLFGSFVEHLGRCVYTGIYEPDHPTADSHGFRSDVAELITELGPTIVRYPGGNFVSAYDWRDGIGPKQDRPVRYDLAWNVKETNQVGTDEFLQWSARLGLEPMMAVNLGTAGVREAVELLQYVNAEPGLALSDERGRNGQVEPYDVRVWCLGNEMDGPWQIGFKTPEEYGRLAEETGRAMKRFDRDLELVACGSSGRGMPTFGSWERIVLERCFDHVEHISAHAYYEPTDGDEQSFLASAEDMDRFISSVVATADHVAATRKSDKKITISFDEWNVWFAERNADHEPGTEAEEIYDVSEAVVVGSLLIELIRHTDRVAVACQAQLVNLLAPILTRPGGPAWRQTIFHPFALTSRHAAPVVLAEAGDGPVINTARYGAVDQLHSVTTHDPDTGAVVIFAVNRSIDTPLGFEVDLGGFAVEQWQLVEHLVITDQDPHARNTETEPDRVRPVAGNARLADGRLIADLPAISWHCIRLAPA